MLHNDSLENSKESQYVKIATDIYNWLSEVEVAAMKELMKDVLYKYNGWIMQSRRATDFANDIETLEGNNIIATVSRILNEEESGWYWKDRLHYNSLNPIFLHEIFRHLDNHDHTNDLTKDELVTINNNLSSYHFRQLELHAALKDYQETEITLSLQKSSLELKLEEKTANTITLLQSTQIMAREENQNDDWHNKYDELLVRFNKETQVKQRLKLQLEEITEELEKTKKSSQCAISELTDIHEHLKKNKALAMNTLNVLEMIGKKMEEKFSEESRKETNLAKTIPMGHSLRMFGQSNIGKSVKTIPVLKEQVQKKENVSEDSQPCEYLTFQELREKADVLLKQSLFKKSTMPQEPAQQEVQTNIPGMT